MTKKLTNDLAREFAELDTRKKEIETRLGEIKSIFRGAFPEGNSIFVPDMGMKVQVSAPVIEKGLDSARMFEDFLAKGRKEDLRRIISITKTAVKVLDDCSSLFVEYEIEGKIREGVVKASPLSKKDRESLAG